MKSESGKVASQSYNKLHKHYKKMKKKDQEKRKTCVVVIVVGSSNRVVQLLFTPKTQGYRTLVCALHSAYGAWRINSMYVDEGKDIDNE